jgi:hypothetical protein
MFSSDRGNTSFGSVEGVGGWPGCDSREVELENRYPWLFPVVLCTDLEPTIRAHCQKANSFVGVNVFAKFASFLIEK